MARGIFLWSLSAHGFALAVVKLLRLLVQLCSALPLHSWVFLSHIIHLLDDVLIIALTNALCQNQLNLFLDFCSYLGVPIAPYETLGPSTTLSFAGIELDSVSLETLLPKDKVDKCLSTISSFIARKKVTLRDIQSLKGMLNFACAVVVPGRAFWRRLIDLTLGLKSPTHFVRITHEVRSDLSVWQTFLASFNGRSFFLEDSWYSSEKLNLYTDGAGTLGFGADFGHKWCYGLNSGQALILLS